MCFYVFVFMFCIFQFVGRFQFLVNFIYVPSLDVDLLSCSMKLTLRGKIFELYWLYMFVKGDFLVIG
jgi:hypothetical protein